jgi:hypothetical protein
MDDLIEQITGGHVTEVKTVLTSIVAALAFYQVLLMAVGYGKLRLPFLSAKAASFSHRSIGDTVAIITAVVAFMCLGYFGIEDGIEHAAEGEQGRVALHVVFGFSLLGVLGLKIAVIRRWHGLGRFLPALGLSVLALFVLTWLSSAGHYL